MSSEDTRTILFGLFLLADREGLTATQLIALATVAGVTATNVKAHLSRMVADGSLERTGNVRSAVYHPSNRKRRVVDAIEQRLAWAHRPWDGRWISLVPMLASERVERAKQRRRLHFDGFREVASNGYARPAWPAPWIDQGIERWHGKALITRGEIVPALAPKSIAKMWQLDHLDERFHRLAAWIAKRASVATPSQALAARLAIGGRVAHLIFEDPLLPPAIWSQRNGITELVRTFRQAEDQLAPLARRFVDDVVEPDAIAKEPHARHHAARP